MKERHELAAEAWRAAPAVIGTAIAGMTLEKWVALATLVYIAIQAGYLLRKWWREETEWGRKMKGKP